MIISTTPFVSGYKIEETLGFISANQVIGNNIISENIASITDFIGGKSGTFRRKLDELISDVIKQLEDQARRLNGNAIVGLSVIPNQISAKGMSMFMITATANVVRVKKEEKDYYTIQKYRRIKELKDFLKEGIINQEQYEHEERRIIDDFEILIRDEEIDYLSEKRKKDEENRMRMLYNEERRKEVLKKRAIEKGVEYFTKECINEDAKKVDEILNSITESKVENVSYDESAIPGYNMPTKIKSLVADRKFTEACSYYMDETGFDFYDAIKYVRNLNQNIMFTDVTKITELITEVVGLELAEQHDKAIQKIVSTASVTPDKAEIIIKEAFKAE